MRQSQPPRRFFDSSFFTMLMLLLSILCLSLACSQKEQKKRGASCKSDEDCLAKWICEEQFCVKGKRDIKELEAKALEEQQRKAKEKEDAFKRKTTTKPGEGRMTVKLCPFFRNTDVAVGTIYATHQQTKQKFMLAMHLETPKYLEKSEFTFYSLPLGKYDVYLDYGIEGGGRFDVKKMKCDPKNKGICQDETTREIEVVLPENEKMIENRPCDWIAQ
jgi:hypothetical protein